MKLSGLRIKDLWFFSIPSIIASVFEPLASIVDTALVGHLDERSLAALALNVAIFNAITWTFNFLVHISTQSIADHQSSKDRELLRSRIKISLILAGIIGLGCSLLLWLPHRFWFSLVGASPEIIPLSEEYFIPRAGFHVFTVFSITTLSILRGFGRLKEVLYLMVLSTGMNIFLSWLMLYPLKMGLAGAAWGTICAHIFTTIAALLLIFLPRKDLRKGFFKAEVLKGQWLHFGRNSLNMFGRSLTLTLCFFLSTKLAANLGVLPLAAHQVLLQVWLLASFFLDGLAVSGNILGAQFYFAGKKKRTAFIFKGLLKLGFGVGVSFFLCYALFWDFITSLFVESSDVRNILHFLKWPIVFSQIISSLAFVFDGLIFGLNGFRYLRQQMIYGALVSFFPFALYSFLYAQGSRDLKWVWWGLIALNLYRLLSGYYFVSQRVFLNFKRTGQR